MSRKSKLPPMEHRASMGEHVEFTAKNAIARAKKYNRKVRMRFNGTKVLVNKRMSVGHVLRTWLHASAKRRRY